jgi:hypothetical protein
LYLPAGFAITPDDKFRNQQVLVVVEIPIGKRIVVDRNVDEYHWFNLNINRRHNWEFDDDWNNNYSWSSNVEYVMTENGLERTERTNQEYNQDNSGSKSRNQRGYRYKNKTDSSSKGKVDSSAHPPAPAKKETNSKSASEQNAGSDEEEKLTLLPMHASLFM